MDIYYKYDINGIGYKSNDLNILKYDNIVYLNCDRNELIDLPILPKYLTILHCSYNNLVNLPILPNNLINLHCYYNKLIDLPILPNCLEILYCLENKLINLPKLSNNLRRLRCEDNKLINLPKINKLITLKYDKYIIKYINQYNIDLIQIKIYYYIKL